MDLLALAQQRYQQLTPLLQRPPDVAASDQLEDWLRQQVCPVVAYLSRQASFRRLARWSVDHLAAPTGRQQRLVEDVAQALVDAARASVEAAGPAGQRVEAGTPLAFAAWMAGRPWQALVSAHDYFHASGSLLLRQLHAQASAEFRQRFELRVPLGDTVCRSLLARVDYWSQKLEKVWRHDAVGALSQAELVGARVQLGQRVQALRQACAGEVEAGRRHACVALVQVYTAYHTSPALDWLGCLPGSASAEAGLIRSLVRPPGEVLLVQPQLGGGYQVTGRQPARLCRPDVVVGIATALAQVAELYRRPVESEEVIGWACQERRLVLVDGRPRRLYWEGEAVPADWDSCPTRWDLLWALARAAKKGQPVHAEELLGPGRSAGAVRDRRHHLSKDLPARLDGLIEAVRPGGYQLRLSPAEIALLSLNNDEQMVEVGLEAVAQL
jgi:hypothetical protein